MEVTQNTLHSYEARSCFARSIRNITFSEPVSGHSVRASYAFVVGEHR